MKNRRNFINGVTAAENFRRFLYSKKSFAHIKTVMRKETEGIYLKNSDERESFIKTFAKKENKNA